jgi:hypothetical protein
LRGRSVSLSLPRRIVIDMLHFAIRVPTVPVQRSIGIASLVAARNACTDRPLWSAIFAKAYALTAREFPELRRAYVKAPCPHLYEYPESVAAIVCRREYRGEPGLFPLLIKDPAGLSLDELSRLIRHATTAPIEEVKNFRRVLKVCQLPRPLRRLLYWLALNIGRQRANRVGTFGLSVYSALGAESLHPLSVWTTLLNYGPITADGKVNVRVIYDHRSLDGATVAQALASLDNKLTVTILDELVRMKTESGPINYARSPATAAMQAHRDHPL